MLFMFLEILCKCDGPTLSTECQRGWEWRGDELRRRETFFKILTTWKSEPTWTSAAGLSLLPRDSYLGKMLEWRDQPILISVLFIPPHCLCCLPSRRSVMIHWSIYSLSVQTLVGNCSNLSLKWENWRVFAHFSTLFSNIVFNVSMIMRLQVQYVLLKFAEIHRMSHPSPQPPC